MKCPLCDLEMRIKRARNIVENDDTPDTETRLFTLHELSCMNRNCDNYDKIVETVKNEIPIG